LAEQGIARRPVLVAEQLLGCAAGIVVALQHFALAGRTGAVAAAVRQDDARVQGAIQHGLPGLDLETVPTGLYRDLETHIQYSKKRSKPAGAHSLGWRQKTPPRCAFGLLPPEGALLPWGGPAAKKHPHAAPSA